MELNDYMTTDWPAAPPMSELVNRVHHADALTLLRAMPDKSVDCIVTDPPYGVKKAEWDSVFPTDWIEEAWRVTDRMLVMSGNMAMIEAGNAIGRYRDCVVMHSRNGMTRSTVAFGNWFPVLVCGDWKWEARPNYLPFNVVTTETINHPSPKPLSAMLKLVEKYTHPDWLVLDPFCGSGTTALACNQLGRKWITCDVAYDYVAIARKRLAQPFTPMFAELTA